MGTLLKSELGSRLGDHKNVGDIRGRGLFIGLELVADKSDKSPLDPSFGISGKIKAAAMAENLMCYPMSGTIDGKTGDHILLAPPFIIGRTACGRNCRTPVQRCSQDSRIKISAIQPDVGFS